MPATRCRPRKPRTKEDAGYRPDRDGAPEEQLKSDGAPTPTEPLDDVAQREWDRITTDPEISRAIGRFDSLALTRLCKLHSQLCRLSDALDAAIEEKKTPNTTPFGVVFDKWYKLAADYGLTPPARLRLRLKPAAEEKGVGARKR